MQKYPIRSPPRKSYIYTLGLPHANSHSVGLLPSVDVAVKEKPSTSEALVKGVEG